MKLAFLLITFFTSLSFANTRVFEIVCKNHDCFKYGWTMTSAGYALDNVCKSQDCAKYGWNAVATDQSTWDVTCRAHGCFTEGWSSVQAVDGKMLNDEATCRNSNCLTAGWTVRTGYDLLGGDVTCNNSDCSRFGGAALWRGHPSKTACYDHDCYHNGWTLTIY